MISDSSDDSADEDLEDTAGESCEESADDYARAPTPMLYKMKAVEAIVSMSDRKIYRLIAAGRFPPPIKIGGSSRWRRKELRAWVAALK